MDSAKRKRLEAQDWRVGSTREFLGLSAEEVALVETKLRLSQARLQALRDVPAGTSETIKAASTSLG
jgi:hypothetical protein